MNGGGWVEGFREPQQERSRRTLSRIVDATETLLVTRGPEEVTVQDVVARAETSVGAFYARFRSRDDAVVYVHQRFWEEAERRWAEFLDPGRWRGVGVGPLVAEIIRRYCRICLSDAERSRAFLLELLSRGDAVLLERVRSLDESVAAKVGRLLEERSEELDVSNVRSVAEEGFRRVLSGVRDHVLFGLEDSPGSASSGARLILSLTRMYGGALGLADRPASYREVLAMCAVAFRPEAGPRPR